MKRRSKYGARKTEAGGQVFASKREARRYVVLVTMERAGEIADLRCQVRYDLYGQGGLLRSPSGRRLQYVADFVYERDGKTVIEDVKGMKTPLYRLKWAVMASMGLQIEEI